MPVPAWEHFHHGADVGIRGFGGTREEAFANAALALTAVVAEPDSVTPRMRVAVDCEAPDDELLFYDWLNALIYEMATQGMLFSRFRVHIEGRRLHGEAWGEKVERTRHEPAVEVKGATLTALHVERAASGGWRAQTVIDV